MALVRSLILSFSLSLAVCRFLSGYLDLDFFLMELNLGQAPACGSWVRAAASAFKKTKSSKEMCPPPAALKEAGEKLKESTEEVGDRLLQALK